MKILLKVEQKVLKRFFKQNRYIGCMPEIMRCQIQSLRKFQFKYGLCQRDEVRRIIKVNKNIHIANCDKERERLGER